MSTLLSATGITKSYGNHTVLRGVTFDVKPREVLGVVGPNGAGKTTLLRLTAGLLAPDAGSLRLAGRPVHRALVHTPVAYFGGGSTLPAGVRAHTWRALFDPSTPSAERRRIHLLSRGTRQMLGLAPVFDAGARRAELIVLDEPWEGLDPDAARWLIQSVRARRDEGAAILVSSHRLHELAEVCDRCAFLVDGRLELVDVRELSGGGALTGAALLAAFDALRQIP